MNIIKWIVSICAAILLVAIVIGVFAFIHIIIAVMTVVFLVCMAAYGIHACFKSRPRNK